MAFERSGVLLVDKPPGPTSHDVVQRVRRVLMNPRIGHTGTLDPFASGLLVLCIGTATRIASLLSGQPKSYQATLTLGASTTTDDPTGDLVGSSDDWQRLDPDRIRRALLDQIGPIDQVPPTFSAKKVGGERVYRLAREGRAPVLAPVRVIVHDIEITTLRLPVVEFTIRCSAGTYVRAIARDAGRRLGAPAHLSALRRTAVGPLPVTGAVALDRIGDAIALERAWRVPLDVLGHLPRFDVDERSAADLAHGRRTPTASEPSCELGVAAHDGRLVALVESKNGWLRPRKVFA
ncbi:MAG: tRNA pseudouridine(55) synthase TruB [Gemmatimonadetes bacterium]|nr:tRNA pseudouridine(55) synthase TruB [Gemmatimonadota bacterium]